ncbi:MAG: hypothetical protein KGK09_06570 [Burkholderiales bacterium]|nr:hypothetical protein [Burkholderiales bacterium]
MSSLAKPLARTPPPMSPPLAAFARAQARGPRTAQAQLTRSVLTLAFGITQGAGGWVADRVGSRTMRPAGLAQVAYGSDPWLGPILDGTLRPKAYALGACAVATAVVAWRRVPRDA